MKQESVTMQNVQTGRQTQTMGFLETVKDCINKHQMLTWMLILFTAFTICSCSDDDNDDDYASFIVGSWNTEEVDFSTHEPTGLPGRYTWTFKQDGTGVWVDVAGDPVTETPKIMYEFRYIVKEYGEETGLWYDFCMDCIFLDTKGETAWTERLCFKKTGKNSCNMYTEGKTLSAILKRK